MHRLGLCMGFNKVYSVLCECNETWYIVDRVESYLFHGCDRRWVTECCMQMWSEPCLCFHAWVECWVLGSAVGWPEIVHRRWIATYEHVPHAGHCLSVCKPVTRPCGARPQLPTTVTRVSHLRHQAERQSTKSPWQSSLPHDKTADMRMPIMICRLATKKEKNSIIGTGLMWGIMA